MANEAVIIELFNGGRPIRFTCADGTGIEKGTLLELTSPRTVIANTNDNAPIAGIAAAEKVASDGATEIAAYTDGIFDMLTDTGTDAVGTPQLKIPFRVLTLLIYYKAPLLEKCWKPALTAELML